VWRKGVPTGPVTTFRDLVVHVPVNFGSTCADTKDTRTAPRVSKDRSGQVMEDVCMKIDRSKHIEFQEGTLKSKGRNPLALG